MYIYSTSTFSAIEYIWDLLSAICNILLSGGVGKTIENILQRSYRPNTASLQFKLQFKLIFAHFQRLNRN